MHPFADLEQVETVLTELAERQPPMTLKLPRQPGRKEHRFTHLLAPPPEHTTDDHAPPPEAARRIVQAEDERIARLEAEVAELKSEFARFRSQFE
jgi:hypothetical protein